MRRAMLELKPTSVDDLAALVALYRPGPMQHIGTFCRAKHGLEQISYPHDDLADILDSTYGVIVYQDQVLKIAQKFAGYSLGAADIMRKAMGKKIAAVMQAERERFMSGALEKGYSREDANRVFELIEPFAGYAFNKAHSYAYGTIAYQTAWLKANYPEEYLTAVLMSADSHPAGTLERIAQAYSECVRLGIPVLPPDVNMSGVNFALETLTDGKTAIRYGLSMIKNVGFGAAESILESREGAGGAFASLDDFCRQLNTHNVNKRALESLVKGGCLDSIAGTVEARGAMLVNLDRILGIAQSANKLKETGQTTMFDLFGDEVATPLAGLDLQSAPVPRGEILAWEKELLGVWISEHPFTHAAAKLTPHVTALCNEITEDSLQDLPAQGRDFVIAGIVGSTRRLTTRDGRGFIAAQVQDLSGELEVTVWPDVYELTSDLWLAGSILLMKVRVRERGDRLTVGVQEVQGYEEDFIPPAWAGPDAISDVPPRRNGNGYGHATGTSLTPVRPEPVEGRAGDRDDGLPPPIEDDTSSEADMPAAAPPSIAEAAARYEVAAPPPMRLTLTETADEGADQKRLATVFRLLQAQPGTDRVLLTIKTRDGSAIELALPTAQLDEELRQKLTEAVKTQVSVA
jgi:DNA polymerase-3 subunit alpha